MKNNIKNELDNIYFIPLGSNCLSAIVVKWSKLNYIPTALNNLINKGGFKSLENIFNGKFAEEVLSDKPKFKKKKHLRGINGESWNFQNYEIVHLDYDNKKEKLKSLYHKTLQILKEQKTNNNMYIVVSLVPNDEKLCENEIIEIKNKLDEFICTDRLLILGAKRDEFTEENIKKYKDQHFVGRFNSRNENFFKVFGEKYFEIYPSNVKELSSKNFFDKIKYVLKDVLNKPNINEV